MVLGFWADPLQMCTPCDVCVYCEINSVNCPKCTSNSTLLQNVLINVFFGAPLYGHNSIVAIICTGASEEMNQPCLCGAQSGPVLPVRLAMSCTRVLHSAPEVEHRFLSVQRASFHKVRPCAQSGPVLPVRRAMWLGCRWGRGSLQCVTSALLVRY